ncbi:MAG: sulfatase-like hydrolase/transferase [Chloroflexota bacterium]|nr:sulfatase-like hydrolase/transferase [Chloroflexota bacterium]
MKQNVIIIMSDSLRRDHVNVYGVPPPWRRPGHENEPFIRTPALDALAEDAMLFDRAYIASYPTIPNRTDLYTGRYGFAYRGWQPLEPEDVILPELVSAHGYTTALFFDTPPLGADNYNFMRGFDAWRWIRGQHGDRYITDPRVPTPINADRQSAKLGGNTTLSAQSGQPGIREGLPRSAHHNGGHGVVEKELSAGQLSVMGRYLGPSRAL